MYYLRCGSIIIEKTDQMKTNTMTKTWMSWPVPVMYDFNLYLILLLYEKKLSHRDVTVVSRFGNHY